MKSDTVNQPKPHHRSTERDWHFPISLSHFLILRRPGQFRLPKDAFGGVLRGILILQH